MKPRISWMMLAASLAVVAACSRQADEPAPTVNEVMKTAIDANADQLWDISNVAIGEAAGLDPARMTDARWDQIAEKAAAVRQGALEIARMDPLVVVRPGVRIADEGVPGGDTGAQVQANIDKDPQKLRDFANALAVHAGDLATASTAHDVARAGLLIDQLDAVCEDCHLEFWYPSQKALLEQYGISR
ncbi:MAG TPA: hypothetical protein VEB68_13600 [Croceibacterium sp.]|nr:hypothetical protein [Croceibacterium sp.]